MVCWVVVIFASLISISYSNPIVDPSTLSLPLAAKGTEGATAIVFPNSTSDEEFEGQFGNRKLEEDHDEESITTVSKELVPNPATSSSVRVLDQSQVEESSSSDTISKANQSEVTVEDEDDQIDGGHLNDQSKKRVATSCGNPQFQGKLWHAVLPALAI